ncbi:MAG TPA: tRNA dihydrouridine synthase DusB [Vicinamibacterales bacterium]|nr:tRNA dihydrouridine synthase DusB [Vicinamibacterales bacterium]
MSQPLTLSNPFGLAPMAGMTDTAFRRLVKRRGGCGLVVTEMVSAEGLVRGIDRTLEYAEFTEEERPVAVQIFGGDPLNMAHAARIVQDLGADAVDVNMGCPVPKIAKHNAGCRLMREPDHAASIIAAMSAAVRIPVTVKMRAGWNEHELNAPTLARALQDAGAAAISIHGRTGAQAYRGLSDWDLIARVATSVSIPVFGNGDLLEPEDLWRRLRESGVAGVLVGRGILRNPWLFAQATALAAGQPLPVVSLQDRGTFLLEYIDLLLGDPSQEPAGFRHRAEDSLAPSPQPPAHAKWRERHVINKLRALSAWYTRGLENGSHLRHTINQTETLADLRATIREFFQLAG